MKFVYYIVFASWYVLSLLPLRVLYVVSDILYLPLFYCIRYRRHIVYRNLKASFPEKSESEILRIEKQFYHFFCDYVVETIKLFSISKKEMMRRMSFSGLDRVQEELEREQKKYCFIYLGHYCNWEYVASMQYWFPDIHCGQIYHPLYNKAFDRLFLRLRGQFGGDNIPMKETLRRIIKLGKGEKKVMIGFIADQAPSWWAMEHWTTFLNHDTAFFMGTERIGRKLDAAVYYLDIRRVKRGYYHAELKLLTLHPNDLPQYRLTDMYSECLEKQIKEAPAYWLWSHNRWKRTKEEWLKVIGNKRKDYGS